jgi:hypothetical protein
MLPPPARRAHGVERRDVWRDARALPRRELLRQDAGYVPEAAADRVDDGPLQLSVARLGRGSTTRQHARRTRCTTSFTIRERRGILGIALPCWPLLGFRFRRRKA